MIPISHADVRHGSRPQSSPFARSAPRVAALAAAIALLAAITAQPADARDRRAGGPIRPVDRTGCSARYGDDDARVRIRSAAFVHTPDAPHASPATDRRRERLAQAPAIFDGRDPEFLFLSHATVGYDLSAGRVLATREPFPAGVADSVRRPGFAGEPWVTRTISRDAPSHALDPEAQAHGAADLADAAALVRVGPYVVPVDPWTPIVVTGPRATREVRSRLEQGRQAWLRERGFTNAVRTFTNDAPALAVTVDSTPLRTATPRATPALPVFRGVSTPSSAAPNSPITTGPLAPEQASSAPSAARISAPAPTARTRVAAPITRIATPHALGLHRAQGPAKSIEPVKSIDSRTDSSVAPASTPTEPAPAAPSSAQPDRE
jgi:hypothetical protein